MQVTSLIGRDRFLSKYNLSINTEDFIDILHEFPQLFIVMNGGLEPDDEFFLRFLNGIWSQRYKTKWREVLYKTGSCYTFNFPELEDFYNVKL